MAISSAVRRYYEERIYQRSSFTQAPPNFRPLEGEPRPAVPAPGTKLFCIEAQGEDRAGIVARVCRVLADRSVNIADLRSEAVPTPSGSALYKLSVTAEVPEPLDQQELRVALDALEDALALEIRFDPA